MILEKTDFLEFQHWVGLVILKELTCNCSNFGMGMMVLQELIFKHFPPLGGCGGLEGTDL